MKTIISRGGLHESRDMMLVDRSIGKRVTRFDYHFENFSHPLIAKLMTLVNQQTLAEALDPDTLDGLTEQYFQADYTTNPENSDSVQIDTPLPQKEIDLSIGGPLSSYNWELLYHIPVAVAVHLSQNQRFAEAEKWYHLVFDPTANGGASPNCWKFLYFRNNPHPWDTIRLLSTSDDQLNTEEIHEKQNILNGYADSIRKPFMPHVVARTRPSAYQYYVVMKYLDNLINWGDSKFAQFTVESLNEATLCYVRAANLLGPPPMQFAPPGKAAAMSFSDLQGKLDELGDASVMLEAQFPFNGAPEAIGQDGELAPLFGVARSLYFCIPNNPTLLGYWPRLRQRLTNIRSCRTLQGQQQALPLFDPPIDPGLLVKAAAAGIDIGTVVSGLFQPVGPLRYQPRIQKAIELCGEVRSLGSSLLSAIEKQDAEKLAQLRQTNELSLQQLTQNVRFLQWKQAEQATAALMNTRATTHERYRFYLRMLGQVPDSSKAPDVLQLDRRELTEDNFDDAYAALVGEYDLPVPLTQYPPLQLDQGQSPAAQSGAAGGGQLFLNLAEAAELNFHMPLSAGLQIASTIMDVVASGLVFIPGLTVNTDFWGLGASTEVFSGEKLAGSIKTNAEIMRTVSQWNQALGAMAARKAGYQRRADDWTLQANLAARELRQIGVQIISSLIAEQIARHEYAVAQTQVAQSRDLLQFLQTKFTNADLYGWMAGEMSDLYYQYYRLALDAARKAEQAMKQELMRPEIDSNTYVQATYWDSGRQGLLAGESLMLDLKRMEADFHDNNKRELELTAHVSLRQIDPFALLSLKTTGSCTFTIPEAFYNRTRPGDFMRRVNKAAVTMPSVVGPYTGVNCAVTFLNSSVRVKSGLSDSGAYGRDLSNPDDRFVDYFGCVDMIVTSGGVNDSGMFDGDQHADLLRPFEGQGAAATVRLSLPSPEVQPFDYATISDLILHIQYTARPGGDDLAARALKELKNQLADASSAGLALLFSLRYDFPTEWAASGQGANDKAFTFALKREYFPFLVQGKSTAVSIGALSLYTRDGQPVPGVQQPDAGAMSAALNQSGAYNVTFPAGTFQSPADVFLILQYGAIWK